MYAKCENQLVLAYIAFFFFRETIGARIHCIFFLRETIDARIHCIFFLRETIGARIHCIYFFFFEKQLVLAYIAFIFSFSRNNWCSHTLHLIFLFRETIGARIHCIYSFFFEKQLVLAYIAFIFSLFCKTGLFCKRASRHRDTERHDTDTAIQQDTVPT